MRAFFVALASATAVTALSLATPANAQGTLRVALPSNVNTLDPAKTKIGEEYIINFLVYSGADRTRRQRQGETGSCRKLDLERGSEDVDVQAPSGREIP
jgi:hypothetical protein